MKPLATARFSSSDCRTHSQFFGRQALGCAATSLPTGFAALPSPPLLDLLALPADLLVTTARSLLIWYRRRLKEWKLCRELSNELGSLRRQRDRRSFWKRLRPRRNRVETGDTAELRRFYKTLVQSVRQYNVRLGLFDYALDRQNKRLDPPFTVGELEKIEKTFRRVQDELHSAIRLLQLAEKNPELDLVQLLRNEYQEDIQRSSEYVSQTVDLGASGQFIHELLVLETNLRQDIAGLTGVVTGREKKPRRRKNDTGGEK